MTAYDQARNAALAAEFGDPTEHVNGHAQPPVDTGSSAEPSWPVLDEAAMHGPVAAYVRDAAPHTEADPVGILAATLVGAGALIGSGPHVSAGNARHGTAIWAVLVGATGKGGKGTAQGAAEAALRVADIDFFGDGPKSRVQSGFGSGEALIDEIRDPRSPEDSGAADKRILVLESEFARFLKVMSRDGSTLSMIAREGWDGKRLQARSRTNGVIVASGYHLVVMGHITLEELRLRMTDTETYGGLAGRNLWVLVKRSHRLPNGGNVPDDIALHHGTIIGKAIATARGSGLLARTPEAEMRWAEVYNELADDDPGGLLGAAIGRDAPQTLRLSVLYALLDGSRIIDVEHVNAAHSFWKYCRESAAHIWQGASGNAHVERLVTALGHAGEAGLDRTAQHEVFGKNLKAEQLDALRRHLIDRAIAVERSASTGGRPSHVLVLSSLVRDSS